MFFIGVTPEDQDRARKMATKMLSLSPFSKRPATYAWLTESELKNLAICFLTVLEGKHPYLTAKLAKEDVLDELRYNLGTKAD